MAIIKTVVRLISEKAACQMLHVTAEELENLCAQAKLTKYQTSDSLVQYDFTQVVEHRRITIGTAVSPPSGNPATPTNTTPLPVQQTAASKINQPAVPADDEDARSARKYITEKKMEKELRSGKGRLLPPSYYHHFIRTPLYCQGGTADVFTLYKPADQPLPEEKLDILPQLYVLNEDWHGALGELQRGITDEIRTLIEKEDFDLARRKTVSFLDQILFEHAESAVPGLENIIEILFTASNRRKGMLTNLVPLIESDLTLGLHSTRVLVLALKFCIKNNYSMNDTKLLCLSTLLHDVGKTMLPDHLINCNPYQLTSEEDLRLFRQHPQIGYNLLEDCGVRDKILKYGALEHHERIDGSGFPAGKRKISFLGQIIGIFDTYDSLCNGRNSTGKRYPSIEALKLMKKECDAGKYSKELFETFVYSLV
jgi:HD-GYP domain-containing protein (c-di-GMP phosphodiesterase class II)